MTLKKILAIIKKDLLILVRDWPGLAILFIMPAVLLVIITFIQENSIPMKTSGTKLAVADLDSSGFGAAMTKDLKESGFFTITEVADARAAESDLLAGKYQVAVIIPDSTTEKLFRLADLQQASPEGSGTVYPAITFICNPTLQPGFRDAITAPAGLLAELSALRIIMDRMTGTMASSLAKQNDQFLKKITEGDFFRNVPDFPFRKEVERSFRNELQKGARDEANKIMISGKISGVNRVLNIDEHVAGSGNLKSGAEPLQNNVPAFTLFAMFFIVIPLAGSLINEKTSGTFRRLMTFPVSCFDIMLSKVVVYLFICVLQFVFLLLIGIYLMPLIGELSPINLDISIPVLAAAVLASSLAAIGFGLMVGTFASNHGQAATFGSVMVVVLAMIGGIFVPSFMLPDFLQKLSMVSPLRWGTDAIRSIFTGTDGFAGILPQLFLLSAFFTVSVLISVKTFNGR